MDRVKVEIEEWRGSWYCREIEKWVFGSCGYYAVGAGDWKYAGRVSIHTMDEAIVRFLDGPSNARESS